MFKLIKDIEIDKTGIVVYLEKHVFPYYLEGQAIDKLGDSLTVNLDSRFDEIKEYEEARSFLMQDKETGDLILKIFNVKGFRFMGIFHMGAGQKVIIVMEEDISEENKKKIEETVKEIDKLSEKRCPYS